MNQADLEAFRFRFRVELIERLALRHALLEPVLNRYLSIEESATALKGWLETVPEITDVAYGDHFRDPAQTALYADEVKELIEGMTAAVDALAREAAPIIARHRQT